ncbi:NAD(P)H-hydrate dehydratase [Salinarchaeum sp. IM2453]|uniref:NAD(P)H-hydrate dehydratase n=1 Tax=Salinarchaeum sp. IM2453 TaxID=2862870 RepID=UPI001C82C1AC|nr:NAD(P)H-hydrate dehydratase [Salinarchaeum sp. IM2453]QZA87950.1 NAD(P)H-hydrate dehydratase [Salinarchaeum sp. IM2453]
MIRSDKVAIIDRNAEALGIPRKQLMESSGHAVAQKVIEQASKGDKVVIIAGRGNNGGDGFVTARFLGDYDVEIFLLGRSETIRTEIARENWQALRAAEYDTHQVRDSVELREGDAGSAIKEADVIIDAMLGTGISGGLREPTATAAKEINNSEGTVVSVDVPTGVDPDTGGTVSDAVVADEVVTFHDMKPGLPDIDATVTVADIGIPEAAQRFVGPGDLLVLDRESDAHKGDHGEILVIGGGPYTGAPALSAQAALRAGADLVHVLCPESVVATVQSYHQDIITHALSGDQILPEHVGEMQELATDKDCVVFGPGLGRNETSLDAARQFLSGADGSIVVDADPLRVVPEVQTDADLLCTPHQGELKAMGGKTDDDWSVRQDLVADFAKEIDQTLLVKGPYDIISDGAETRVNRTGNPGMTVGGTGDVLAGVTGALFARVSGVTAGGLAAYITGRAGDEVARTHSHGLMASDLPDVVSEIITGETNE